MKIVKTLLLFTLVLGTGPLSSGAVNPTTGIGSSPAGGGFTWGVGVGGNCSDVVDLIRRNWMDVKPVISPKSKAMRPRSREFYCVSPYYTQDAHPKVVSMLSGLKCFDLNGLGFCCDADLRQCAAM